MPAGEVIENPAALMRLQLIRTAAETDGELLEIEATYGPGSLEPVEHVHPRQDEHFEVLTGAMNARIGGVNRTLTAGDSLDVPAGMPHAMWNGGDGEARLRWQTRPALRSEEFFRALGRLAREGKLTAQGATDVLAGAAVMHEFRREFRLTKPAAPVQAIALPLLAALARLRRR